MAVELSANGRKDSDFQRQRSKKRVNKKELSRRTDVYSWGEKPGDDGVSGALMKKIMRFLFWKGLPGFIALNLCAQVLIPEIRLTRIVGEMMRSEAPDPDKLAMMITEMGIGDDHPCGKAIDAAYEDMMDNSGGSYSERDAEKMLAKLDEGCSEAARGAMRRGDGMRKASRSAASLDMDLPAGPVIPAEQVFGEDTYRDCPDCPVLRRISAGAGQGGGENTLYYVDEPFFISVSEVSVESYRTYLRETGGKLGKKCWTYEKAEWAKRKRNVLDPGFEVNGASPAVCVSKSDAEKYANWLSERTGERYRLPTEMEWARAAYQTEAELTAESCSLWNAADKSSHRRYPRMSPAECDDGHFATASATDFVAGEFRLANMTGNVWEWVEDAKNYEDRKGLIVGGGWSTSPDIVGPHARSFHQVKSRSSNVGFRVVREKMDGEVKVAGLRRRQ